MSPSDKTQAFLNVAQEFKLGHLTTEGFHAKTTHLSTLVNTDIAGAMDLLQEVDRDALKTLRKDADKLWALACDIQKTLKDGHKVYLCGCGATGRLSLVLETLYHQKFGNKENVISFMAGGDFALIKSVESFEDRPAYGERQLIELGFGPNDLLIASSEGGETPFVIGAAEKASIISSRKPYFLFCNPDEELMSIKRSRNLIENEKINKISLVVGPMAISGSTRMQASTVLMLGIGVGLLYSHADKQSFDAFFENFIQRLTLTDYRSFAPLTKVEANLYKAEKFLNYVTDPSLGISILTDTTERSPTFSLRGFENRLDHQAPHALCYLFLPEAETSGHAWSELLSRAPRPLAWEELDGRVNLERILGFDISKLGLQNRSLLIPTEEFSVTYEKGIILFRCQKEQVSFNWGTDQLFNHLMVKMLLNAHSTLIMGLLGRYEGNVMTWVRSSNNKLIDRAARYVMEILKQRGKSATYEDVVLKIFEEAQTLGDNEAIVLKVVERF